MRVVAPAMSMGIIGARVRKVAVERLEGMELRVSFGRHCEEMESSSVKSRVEDLHEAFADTGVGGILTVIGGFNSIQLLEKIDWDLVGQNPKIFCGYSDVSVLQNAMWAKCGLVSYSGPHFSTFGCEKGLEYVLGAFEKMMFGKESVEVEPAEEWIAMSLIYLAFAVLAGFLR